MNLKSLNMENIMTKKICARIFGFKAILIGYLLTGAAWGGVAELIGAPITPYQDQPTLRDVRLLRERELSEERIFFYQIEFSQSPHILFSKSELCFAKDGKCVGSNLRTLSGKDVNGNTQTIQIYDIQSLRLLEPVDYSKAIPSVKLEINVFPDITPEELLRNTPEYSELYAKTFILTVELGQADNSRLAFGPLPCCPEQGVALVEDVKISAEITASPEGGERWWATPSVVKDRNFPFRNAVDR